MNNDLILREHLAIERTKLANERTLLAYFRTGLYFIVAGSTLGEFVDTQFWRLTATPLLIIGAIICVTGVVRFMHVRKVIATAKANIAALSHDFLQQVRRD